MVYLNYDQTELDAQYNLRERHPEFQTYFDSWDHRSKRSRTTLNCHLNIHYGPSAKETLDIFPAKIANAPVHIFIHGGYWQNLDKKDYSYLAEPLVSAGITTVIINYDLVPNVNIDEIVRQNRAALAWTWHNATSYGGNRNQISVSGHSAGGHLVLMLLATEWKNFDTQMPSMPIVGACAICGIYDLKPIQLSYQNEVLKLDDAAVARNSPLYNLPQKSCPLTLAYGADETDEFARQTQTLAKAWIDQGLKCQVVAVETRNHFNVIDDITIPDTELSQALITLAKPS